MKIKVFVLMIVGVLSLASSKSASAQCWHPNYSTYTARSASSVNANPNPTLPGAGYTLYKTITVTGTTTIDLYCPVVMNVHCARVTNQIATQGGVFMGGCVCPACYMNYAPTVSMFSSQPGVEWGDISDTELECSMACQFLDFGNSILAVEFAYTRSLNTGVKVA